jgi:RNA polymerase sigma factor (sigma-70 family)
MAPTDSFSELYRTYFPAAAGLARGLTRDHATADDVAAEGLLRVWRHWDGGQIAQPWGYIRRTVVNETITRARKHAREQAATARYQPPVQRGLEDAVGDRDLVARLLNQLPPHQRRIIELRFLEDLTESEAALRLGVSVGAVKSGTSRGLARLRAGVAADPDQLAA